MEVVVGCGELHRFDVSASLQSRLTKRKKLEAVRTGEEGWIGGEAGGGVAGMEGPRKQYWSVSWRRSDGCRSMLMWMFLCWSWWVTQQSRSRTVAGILQLIPGSFIKYSAVREHSHSGTAHTSWYLHVCVWRHLCLTAQEIAQQASAQVVSWLL